MSQGKFELDRDGMNELLHSKGLETALREKANEVKEHCGERKEEYAVGTYSAQTRVIAGVITATPAAIRSNRRHNTLLKALGEVSQ